MDYGRLRLSVFTLLHFSVDLTCIYYLMSTVSVSVADHDLWLVLAVLYNFMAFAMPAVLGYLTDIIDKCEVPAALGCLLILVGILVPRALRISVVLIGLGNGLFHIGAGRKVLIESESRYAPCGIFISAGAIGVYLGNFWGSCHYVLHGLFAVIMAVGAVIMFLIKDLDSDCGEMYERRRTTSKFEEKSSGRKTGSQCDEKSVNRYIIIWFVLLFSVVAIRSYYGYQTAYTWKTGFAMGLLFTLFVAAGKFIGGIAADRTGVKATSMFSLIAAGILAVFSFEAPACGMISIMFFNMTMPLTLSLMHRTFENKPGFAFGILMLALFLGTLPTMLWKNMTFSSPVGLALLCGISLVMMLAVIAIMKKCGKKT